MKRVIIRIFLFFVVTAVLCADLPAASAPRRFTIIQMNDVYEVFPIPDLVDHQIMLRGGLAYAGAMINAERKRGPVLVLHAGDFISPSLLSIKFKHKGAQMVDAMNAMGTDMVTFGNHEFDFGCEVLADRIKQSNFQWLSANVNLPSEMKLPSGKVRPYKIKHIAGMRVGIFAVTTPMEPVKGCGEGQITFDDPFEASKKMVALLKELRVDLIIALTHLRMKDDHALAVMLPEIDFIVGGHDHEPIVEVVGRTLITKAGANAHTLGYIGVKAARSSEGWIVEKDWRREPVDPISLTPDAKTAVALEAYAHQMSVFEKVVGSTEVALDVREDTVREKESNFGNYLTDVMRHEMKTDIALINGGAFRGDRIIPPGSLTLNDLYSVLLFENQLRTIDITGRELLEALENGVSQIGEKSGRFPQISGFRFTFDPDKPPGQRVLRVKVGDVPLELGKTYTMATIDFLLDKGSIDGYRLPKQNMKLGAALNDLIIQHLQVAPLRCEVEGRIMQE